MLSASHQVPASLPLHDSLRISGLRYVRALLLTPNNVSGFVCVIVIQLLARSHRRSKVSRLTTNSSALSAGLQLRYHDARRILCPISLLYNGLFELPIQSFN